MLKVLGDNLKYQLDAMGQRSHSYATLADGDSLLRDEARAPLILSRDADGWRPYNGGGMHDPASITGGHFDHLHVTVKVGA